MATEILILGAGVIGLTVAHVLASDGYKVTIVARDMPGDWDSQAWASPWAGANWSPIGGSDERLKRWEAETFDKLWDMIPTGLVMSLPSRAYYDKEDALSKVWYQNLVRDFHVLPESEIPPGYKTGFAYNTLSVNPMTYLPWLQSELVSRGVKFVRRHVKSINDAASLVGPDVVVVNATSLGSRSLIGVEDTKLYPIRGQTIHVHAPDVKGFFYDEVGDSYVSGMVTYVIPRPGGDTALLGGTYLRTWDTSYDALTAQGILERCTALVPALAHAHVLGHGVGLRPAREGGPRVEAEWVEIPVEGKLVPQLNSKVEEKKIFVVHAYGFGGAGYQNSWGAAAEVASILKSSVWSCDRQHLY